VRSFFQVSAERMPKTQSNSSSQRGPSSKRGERSQRSRSATSPGPQHPSPPHGFPRVERGVVVRKRRGVKKPQKKPRYTAASADKYELYQKAVQSPELDVPFLRRVFKTTRGREALHFREDFCGTGLLSATWLKMSPPNATAEGFDLDPEPVGWGLAHNFEPLGERASRYTVHLKDIRASGTRPYDLRVAQNFSYCILKTREEMLDYFERARESLADDGLFVIDLYGGGEAVEEMEEETKLGGFTYVWDQHKFHPGTGEFTTYISFRFPDGSEMKNAFKYVWRMWFLTELVDVMIEAGFERVDRYFEGWNKDGTGGDGVFRKGLRGENCASWIAYLVGVK
jgi:hypothetical protein